MYTHVNDGWHRFCFGSQWGLLQVDGGIHSPAAFYCQALIDGHLRRRSPSKRLSTPTARIFISSRSRYSQRTFFTRADHQEERFIISGTKHGTSVSLFSSTKNVKGVTKRDMEGLCEKDDLASLALFSKLFWKMKLYSVRLVSQACWCFHRTLCWHNWSKPGKEELC